MNHWKGSIMKLYRAAVAVSLFIAGTAAMAVEATQWNLPSGRVSPRRSQSGAGARHRERRTGRTWRSLQRLRGPAPQSTLTRAEAKKELARARANGELEGRNEAYGGFREPHRPAAIRSFALRKPHQAKAASAAGE
jgi:hypothetical protein